ncbi:MAG: hypothetical protein ACI8ZM_001107 [Crocinitomix sp.]
MEHEKKMQIRKVLIILIISGSFIWSCNQEPQKKESLKIESFPVVINTGDCLEGPIEEEYLSNSYYKLLYIGPTIDSIKVDWLLSANFYNDVIDLDALREDLPPAEYRAYHLSAYSKNLIPAELLDLKIRIDTSQFINDIFRQYPVFITNISLDTAIIASRYKIPAIMEAMNERGEWRAIQEPLIGCGTGVTHVKLPPNEIVMSYAPIFNGEFKTAFRIRIGDNISNIFFGSINPNQFESPYDKYGNYK